MKARSALEKGDAVHARDHAGARRARGREADGGRGREGVFARHRRNADATRTAAQALGLTLLAEVPSNAVTAVIAPVGIDSGAVVKTMEKRYGVKIAGGQDQLKGKIFRLGHIGWYDEGDILRMAGAFESALIDHGWKAEPGTAVRAAQRSFRGADRPLASSAKS